MDFLGIGEKLLDPGNIFGVQGNPMAGMQGYVKSQGQYQIDPSMFQLGSAGVDQYGMGGVAGTYANRDASPATTAMLQGAAYGTAPSAAQALMGQSLASGQAQAMGSAMGGAGMSPALAMRMGLRSQGDLALQSQSQLGAMRAQEQATARNQLAQWQSQQQDRNDQMTRYFMSLGYDMDEARMKSQIALASSQYQSWTDYQNRMLTAMGGAANYELNRQNATTAAGGAIAGHFIGGGGGGGGQG